MIVNLYNWHEGFISGCVVGRSTNDRWMYANKLI